MNRTIIALIVALLATAACASDVASPAPDFTWGASSPASVKMLLKQAETKWREAAAVPTSPASLKSPKSKAFDESYLREILNHDDFAYDLLDAGMAKLKAIDESKTLCTKALSAAGSQAPASAKTFDDTYYLLRSRIRLAIGLSRAQISREMTDPDTSSYCFQAMESAIDALRDAAADAEKSPDGAARAEQIRSFRTGLFNVWEAAERTKNLRLIEAIDLRKLWDSSFICKQPDKK